MIRRSWSIAALAVLAASGRAFAQPGRQGTLGRPIDLSLNGHLGDSLFDFTTVAVSLLFVIMVGVIIWSMVRHNTGHKAHYEHGIGRKHLVFTAIIASLIFFGIDGTLLVNSYADLHEAFYKFPKADEHPLRIEIMAQQWAWNFREAGPDGKFNTADDVVSLNDLHIPTGRPVVVQMKSKDVLHSFYLPNFRQKQDVVPGTMTKMWFQAVATGVVEIGCAQHCGTNHYKMRGALTVQEPADYDAWYKGAVADGERRFDTNDNEAHWGWDWENE